MTNSMKCDRATRMGRERAKVWCVGRCTGNFLSYLVKTTTTRAATATVAVVATLKEKVERMQT